MKRYCRRAIGLVLCAVIVSISFLQMTAQALSQGDGSLFYGVSTNTTPQYKSYTGSANTFGTAGATVTGTQPVIVQQKTSPTRVETIAGYEDASGNLQIMCYNGMTWTNEWTVVVGGTGTTRRFDIAYETSTGDVTVAYSRNTAAVNALAYRTKSGSTGCGTANWAAATNFPTTTSTTTGTVQWVKASYDHRNSSILDAFVWADSNSDLGAAVWSGSAFTNFKLLETSLEVISTVQDIDDFDVEYESLSGDLMVVWANSVGTTTVQGAFYSTCTGGTSTCTWLTPVKISTAAGDDAASLDLSSDPVSDKMAFASIGKAGGANLSTLQAAYWSGSAWTMYADLDGSSELPIAGSHIVQTGWVTNGSFTKWVINYDDSTGTGISWYAATPGSTPTAQTAFTTTPALGDIRERYQMDNSPFNNAQLVMLVSDSTKAVVAARLSIDAAGALTWANSAATAVATINAVPAEGMSFAYGRYIGTLGVDIVDGSGASVLSPSIAMSGLVNSNLCQTTTGTLGIASQKIRQTNTTGYSPWSLSIAASGGTTANWSAGTDTYDYNDAGTGGCTDSGDADNLAGQLSVNPTVATNTPQSGCTTTGVSLGSSSAFSQGVTDSITLASASTSALPGCYWDITGITLSQKVPALQAAGSYALQLTLTSVAN